MLLLGEWLLETDEEGEEDVLLDIELLGDAEIELEGLGEEETDADTEDETLDEWDAEGELDSLPTLCKIIWSICNWCVTTPKFVCTILSLILPSDK